MGDKLSLVYAACEGDGVSFNNLLINYWWQGVYDATFCLYPVFARSYRVL